MKQVYYSWDKWECYKAGFYSSSIPGGITPDEARELYKSFLGDLHQFEDALKRVISEWKYSCEHFLTNPNINRIAWLGQASACIALGLPSRFKGGFRLLSIQDQAKANALAERYFRIWKRKYENTLRNGNDKDIQLIFPMMCQMN